MGILKRLIVIPPFTRVFLKSPSSRGLSAIAELLVDSSVGLQDELVLYCSRLLGFLYIRVLTIGALHTVCLD